MEFSKRFKVEEVWPAELIAKQPSLKGKTLFDVLYANGKVNKYPLSDLTKVNGKYIKDYANDESKAFGFYVQKACLKSTPSSVVVTAMTSHRSILTTRCVGCVGPWLKAKKRCGASVKAMTPM